MRRILTAFLAVLCLSLVMSATAWAGDRAPVATFKAKTMDGTKIKSSDYEGKVLLVAFWATWCKPCLQELPHLVEFHKKYKDQGFELIIVSTDGPETAAKVKSTIRNKKLGDTTAVHDQDGSLAAKLNPRGTNPFTVYVDHTGRVAETHEGFSPGDEKKAEKLIVKLLEEKKASEK